MNLFLKWTLTLLLTAIVVTACKQKGHEKAQDTDASELLTPLGKPMISDKPTSKMLAQHKKAKEDYLNTPDNPENIIWYGRRTAYLGNYLEAISIFTEGIDKFPQDPRFYRHRGHRYISVRKFDAAIADLEKAAQLIQGTSNEMEPDGMPNAQNIPVSSLHGNIWYHLGLAYYLIHDYKNAYSAYLNCRNSGENPDNVVSSTHWLYMIQRRIGNKDKADSLLLPIKKDAAVIENTNYYALCKFYKGIVPKDSLISLRASGAASDAVTYGLANWYFYNGDKENSKVLLQELVQADSWSSFGYIAAESDLIHYFNLLNKTK